MRISLICAYTTILFGTPAMLVSIEAAAQELELRRVMLSAGGVGYFEYEARVSGDATLELGNEKISELGRIHARPGRMAGADTQRDRARICARDKRYENENEYRRTHSASAPQIAVLAVIRVGDLVLLGNTGDREQEVPECQKPARPHRTDRNT